MGRGDPNSGNERPFPFPLYMPDGHASGPAALQRGACLAPWAAAVRAKKRCLQGAQPLTSSLALGQHELVAPKDLPALELVLPCSCACWPAALIGLVPALPLLSCPVYGLGTMDGLAVPHTPPCRCSVRGCMHLPTSIMQHSRCYVPCNPSRLVQRCM
jgi:hypothetical protein